MSTNNNTKAQTLSDDKALIAGIQKYLPNNTFTVQSQSQTTAQVVTVLQARVDKAQAVVDARNALHTAVLAAEVEDVQSTPYVRSVRQGVSAMYANSPTILTDFNLVARKAPEPLTTAQKVIAAAKRAATRAARHTMGAVQKQAVTGSVTEPVVVGVDGKVSASSSSSSSPAATPPATPPAAPVVAPPVTPVVAPPVAPVVTPLATPPAAPVEATVATTSGSTPHS